MIEFALCNNDIIQRPGYGKVREVVNYEFPLYTKDNIHGSGYNQVQGVMKRFAQLKEIADKLMQEKWYVDWTVTGLAFWPPGVLASGDSASTVRDKLAALGIHENFREKASCSFWGVLANRIEYQNRVRALINHENGSLPQGLTVDDANDGHGILVGRLQALQWLLGERWPALKEDDDKCDYYDPIIEDEWYYDVVDSIESALFGETKKHDPATGTTCAEQ